jgi:hypothetical protein
MSGPTPTKLCATHWPIRRGTMADYTWKDWPEDCPECKGPLLVFSDDPEDGRACDGDKVRCVDPECGAIGQISADAEDCCYAVFFSGDDDQEQADG